MAEVLDQLRNVAHDAYVAGFNEGSWRPARDIDQAFAEYWTTQRN